MRLVLRIGITALSAVLALFFCACGGPAEISDTDSKMIEELGGVFVEDLNYIILNREAPEVLAEWDYVVYSDEKMLGSDPLARFYIECGDKLDTEITMVFSDDSFVVARMVFKNGKGVYLRYEYSKANPGDLTVNGELFDSVSLKYYEAPPKWEMGILNKNRLVAAFSFNNPQD